MSVRLPPNGVDLAIVTALPEELDPVLNLIGGRERWESFTISKFTHYYGRFEFGALSFSVVACSLWKYGSIPTALQVSRLEQVAPQLIVMTGICAGWQARDIQLGDLIVADRAFRSGEGKLTSAGHQPDIWTYSPPTWLIQWLKDFEHNQHWASTIRTPRPQSLRYQAEWLLCQRAEHGNILLTKDEEWAPLKANRIDYPRVKQWLQAQKLVTERGAKLTKLAQKRLTELREHHHGQPVPMPDRPQPIVHYKAFASSDAVVAIDNPFSEHAKHVRGIGALEMEVATVLEAAEAIGRPAFAVKGVSDYATPDKDDTFHTYAAEASARWMYAFLRAYAAQFRAELRHVTPVPDLPPPVAAANETLIVLAEFDGIPHGRSIPASRYIRAGITAEGQPLGLSSHALRLEAFPRVLTSSHEARNLGSDARAALVVWGELDDVKGVHTLVELIPAGLVDDSPLHGAWLPLGSPSGVDQAGDRRVLTAILPAQAAYLITIGLSIIATLQGHPRDADALIAQAFKRAELLQPYGQDAHLAYAWRGYFSLLREHYQAALADLSQALELQPHNAIVRAWRGVVAFADGQLDLAFDDLAAARAKLPPNDPRRAKLLSDLGWIFQNRGEIDEALACYVEAHSLLQETDDVRTWTLNIWRIGRVLEHKEQLDDAQSHYEYALTESQRHDLASIEIATLQSLGGLLNRQGRPQQAINLFEQTLRRFEQRGALTSQGRVLKAVAGLHLQLGDPQAAIAALQRAQALFPSGTPEVAEIAQILRSLEAAPTKKG